MELRTRGGQNAVSRRRERRIRRSAAIPMGGNERSDAMKERASAPGGCWKLHASVSTRLGGPYDGSL
jgi:hypothetical protein